MRRSDEREIVQSPAGLRLSIDAATAATVTRNAARGVAEAIGAEFFEFDVDRWCKTISAWYRAASAAN